MSEQPTPFHKLEQLNAVIRRANIAKAEKTVRQNMADTFGINPKDDDIIFSRIKQTRKLILEVQRELKKLSDIDPTIYFPWIPRALLIFKAGSNLDYGWPGPTLSPEELVRIDFCIHALKKHYTEEWIAEEKLQEIRKSTEELKADILKAEFESDLEEALVDALQALLTAIDEYSLRGTVRLKEGLSVAVGTVIINFGLLAKPEEQSKWQKYSQPFTKIVTGLWALIQFVAKNKTEIGTTWTVIQKFIGGGSEPPTENK